MRSRGLRIGMQANASHSSRHACSAGFWDCPALGGRERRECCFMAGLQVEETSFTKCCRARLAWRDAEQASFCLIAKEIQAHAQAAAYGIKQPDFRDRIGIQHERDPDPFRYRERTKQTKTKNNKTNKPEMQGAEEIGRA